MFVGAITYLLGVTVNQITDPPLEHDFGLDFDYSVWTADTELTFVNVPFGNDYRDVVEQTPAQFNSWIDGQPTETLTFGDFTKVLPGTPIKIHAPLNSVNRFNYVRVHDPAEPVQGGESAYYYYFVLDMQYVNAETTAVIVQLDVWSTYRHKVRVLRGFVERSHVGIANTQVNDDRGRRWLTVPEGFDTGADYRIAGQKDVWRSASNNTVIITSVTDLETHPGTIDDPVLQSAPGGYLQAVPTATKSYAIDMNELVSYFTAMRQYPWVTQGIISVKVVPNLASFGYSTPRLSRTDNYPPGPSGSASYLREITSWTLRKAVSVDIDWVWDQVKSKIPTRYRHLTKFGTSPYTFLECSNLNGSVVAFRPELFMNGTVQFDVLLSLIPGGERIELASTLYNTTTGNVTGEGLDNALVTGSLPSLPVLNDMSISALASTAHGRSAALSAADWSQQLALESNQNAYDGAALSASTSLGNDAIMRNLAETVQGLDHRAAQTEQLYSNIQGLGVGAIGGATMGGGAGAVVGAAGGIANMVMSTAKLNRMQEVDRQRLGMTSTAASNVSTANYNTSTTINESNKGLADRAARGNYEQAIGAMAAKVQDTRLNQPALGAGYGGEFLRYMAEGFTFIARARTITPEAVERIGEHWLRYGYALRAFMKIPESLLVMSKFTYWKMSEVYLDRAPIPELYKRTLTGILDKGVTVWRSPDDIGTTDLADNTPLANITIER